jgi:hypothetical protein
METSGDSPVPARFPVLLCLLPAFTFTLNPTEFVSCVKHSRPQKIRGKAFGLRRIFFPAVAQSVLSYAGSRSAKLKKAGGGTSGLRAILLRRKVNLQLRNPQV